MNKELIKTYFKEFEHWLNGGKVLSKYTLLPEWSNCQDENIWRIPSNNITKVLIVIDDEYVEFRKALAEGKIVQYKDREGFWNKIEYKLEEYHLEELRIKPDEPKFKIGDWITDGIEVWQHKENCRVKNQTSWNLWQPKPGEWCWVFNKLREVPVLRRVIKVEGNFKNRFDDEKFTKAVRVSRGDDLSDEVGYRFCEPFIGQLPTNIKE